MAFSPDNECPKCGVEMEPIEVTVEELPIQQLQLCPKCYLVTWRDHEGLHSQQGFPLEKGAEAETEAGSEPEEC
jgi:hypothetical protein